VVAWGALFFLWSLLRHSHFGSGAYELGVYHSVMWNIAFRGTPWNSLERVHQWAIHIEPGVVWLAPLYRILPSPAWLWLTESAALAASALPIDALARRITGDRVVALLAAAAALATPQLVLGELGDFHTLALCALPLGVMAWAIEADSSRGLALGSLAAMLLREQMGLIVAGAAVVWVIRQGRRRAIGAVLLAGVALAFSAIELLVIIPSFGSGQSFHYAAEYGSIGGGPEAAARAAVSHPIGVLSSALKGGRLRYVALLASGALPLVVLSARSLRRSAWPLLFALPELALQLLSGSSRKWDIHTPYGVPLVPLVAAAAVLSLRWVPTERDGRRVAAAAWLSLTLIHGAEVFPSPVGRGRPIDPGFTGSPRAAALDRAIAQVPADASISAQDNVVPHVAARAEVHRFPDGRVTDDYLLLDIDGPAPNVKYPAGITEAVRRLRADPHFEVLVDEAGVLLVKRVPRG
jgi:uncharacterized membrane protein